MLRCLIFIVGFFPVISFGQVKPKQTEEGYEIKINLPSYKDQLIGFGHYFGSEFIVMDSAYLDNSGHAVFKGAEPLSGGIYLVFISGEEEVVNFLVDRQQHFSVTVNMNDPYSAQPVFTGSPENTSYYAYRNFKAAKENEIRQAQYDMAAAKDQTDSTVAHKKLETIAKELNEYRNMLIRKDPDSFLSALLSALNETKLPPALETPANAADSAAQHRFIRDHYWDGVHFWDGRLAYTTFFGDKIDRYFSEVLEQNADSVIKQVKGMMSYAGNNEAMSHLLLSKLLYGSMYHQYKWEDTVFIHLFENYVAGKSYKWMTDRERSAITERAYFLMSNIKGKPAANIILPGTDNNLLSLADVKANYTLVAFWDPTCHHCRETLPQLDSMYRTKWKNAGLKIFSVAVETDGSKKDWYSFINEHSLQEWSNVYYSAESVRASSIAGQASAMQDYDVWYYPSFYLLDKDKHFMGRKLSYKQAGELLENILGKTLKGD